jgi:hypothetical protein
MMHIKLLDIDYGSVASGSAHATPPHGVCTPDYAHSSIISCYQTIFFLDPETCEPNVGRDWATGTSLRPPVPRHSSLIDRHVLFKGAC